MVFLSHAPAWRFESHLLTALARFVVVLFCAVRRWCVVVRFVVSSPSPGDALTWGCLGVRLSSKMKRPMALAFVPSCVCESVVGVCGCFDCANYRLVPSLGNVFCRRRKRLHNQVIPIPGLVFLSPLSAWMSSCDFKLFDPRAPCTSFPYLGELDLRSPVPVHWRYLIPWAVLEVIKRNEEILLFLSLKWCPSGMLSVASSRVCVRVHAKNLSNVFNIFRGRKSDRCLGYDHTQVWMFLDDGILGQSTNFL